MVEATFNLKVASNDVFFDELRRRAASFLSQLELRRRAGRFLSQLMLKVETTRSKAFVSTVLVPCLCF